MRNLIVLVLLMANSTWAQTSVDFFNSWSDEMAEKYFLKGITLEEKQKLFLEQEITTQSGITIFLNHLDSTGKSFSIGYSENFDEVNYSLGVINQKNIFFVFINEGDHCCDWLLGLAAYEFKKGQLKLLDINTLMPQVEWTHFMKETPSGSEYPFLNLAPKYYMEYGDSELTLHLAYEFYALEYEKGSEFLDKYGKEIGPASFIWKKKKFIYTTE